MPIINIPVYTFSEGLWAGIEAPVDVDAHEPIAPTVRTCRILGLLLVLLFAIGIPVHAGMQFILRYFRSSDMPFATPSRLASQRLTEIVAEISKAKMFQDLNLVEFQHKLMSGEKYWKGLLEEVGPVFTEQSSGGEVLVGKKEEIVFSSEGTVRGVFKRDGKTVIGEALQATFKIGNRTLRGTILPEAFEKWKQGANVSNSTGLESPPSELRAAIKSNCS